MLEEEIFDVVNEHDEPIGTAARSVVHREGLLHRSAHVLVFDRAGRLFMQRRGLSKDTSPGDWDTSAAGHLNAGENYPDAALRELAEELGVRPLEPLTPLMKLPASVATGQEFVWVFRGVVDPPVHPDPSEIMDGRWCTVSEIAAWIARAPADFTSTFLLLWGALALR